MRGRCGGNGVLLPTVVVPADARTHIARSALDAQTASMTLGDQGLAFRILPVLFIGVVLIVVDVDGRPQPVGQLGTLASSEHIERRQLSPESCGRQQIQIILGSHDD